MFNDCTPWSSLAGITTAGVLTDGWNLAECADPAFARRFTFHVPFATPFNHVPVVQAGLVGFDMDKARSARLTTRAENISPFGFDLAIATWDDTLVYSVEVSWLAIGP